MKVTKQLVNAVLAQTTKEALKQYFLEVFIRENRGYGDDMRTMNLLLTGEFKTVDDFDIDVIIPNIGKHIYRSEDKEIHDVRIKRVDNIEASIYVAYKEGTENYEYETTIPFTAYEDYYKEFLASNAAGNVNAD